MQTNGYVNKKNIEYNNLWHFTQQDPIYQYHIAKNDLACIILIVMHADQLLPPSNKSEDEVWTVSSEFMKDHDYAKKSCERILSNIHQNDKDLIQSLKFNTKSIWTKARHCARILAIQTAADLSLCDKFQERTRKEYKKKYGKKISKKEMHDAVQKWIPTKKEIEAEEEKQKIGEIKIEKFIVHDTIKQICKITQE